MPDLAALAIAAPYHRLVLERRITSTARFDVAAYGIAAVELLALVVWVRDLGTPARFSWLFGVGPTYYAMGLALMMVAGAGVAVLWPAARAAYFGQAQWRRSATCLVVTTVLLLGQLASMALLELALSGPMVP